MGEEKLYFLLLRSIKRPKGPLVQSVSANFVADFEITRMISDQTALHSVQLPLLIMWVFGVLRDCKKKIAKLKIRE